MERDIEAGEYPDVRLNFVAQNREGSVGQIASTLLDRAPSGPVMRPHPNRRSNLAQYPRPGLASGPLHKALTAPDNSGAEMGGA